MQAYLIRANLPKNPTRVVRGLKRRILDICIDKGIECVVEFHGIILLFSSENICDFLSSIKEIRECRPVRIFRDPDSLVLHVISGMDKCKNFAVRCNRMHVAQEIGGKIHEALGIPANLENPDCEIRVEYRNGLYILLE